VFENLHMLENLQLAKDALKGKSGIYAFVHIVTGTCYIGSSINLADRIMDHINGNSSNQHLQYAIAKYGLPSFAFVILQYCIPSDLLELEQHYLDILFSLPTYLRYNFLPTAGSMLGYKHTEEALAKMSGRTHTPETRAQMSDSQKLVDRTGALNPMYGKVPASAFQSGHVPANAMTINV
jgi:group I intron endonuclease